MKNKHKEMKMDYKLFEYTEKIYDHLTDDLSKHLFNLRTMYSIGRITRKELTEENTLLFNDWNVPEIEDAIADNGTNEICIFGAGDWGRMCYSTLIASGYSDFDIIFADNNSRLWGGNCQGRTVINPGELKQMGYKGIVIVATANAFSEIYHQLLFLVDRNQIFAPANGTLIGRRGNQYFDYFNAGTKEVFVDCGCYNGNDTINFTKWCNREYEYIYCFEPNKSDYLTCEQVLKRENVDRYSIFNVACEDRKGEIPFVGDPFVLGHVSTKGSNYVECDTIDNLCDGRLTLIKMDIEGEELNAIKGAKCAIREYKPKLAITIYHKPEDIWSIPREILSIDETYKFAIRQYWMWPEECVLYAY